MREEKKKISYFNTLIFTIIAGIFSILLLLLLFVKGFKTYLPFIITLEVGIFVIIAICIIQIILNERLFDKLKKNNSFNINFSSCPDYYTKRDIGTTEICSNEYIYTDEQSRKFIMKIYPDDDKLYPLPASYTFDYIENTDTQSGQPKYEKFPLHEIENNTNLKTYNEKCAILNTDPTDLKLTNLKGYNLVPWTTMNAKCASLI